MSKQNGQRPLTLTNYQHRANKTAVYPNKGQSLTYTTLGLLGEVGEVAEHLKKTIRDDRGKFTPERKAAIRKELGDVLWYIAMCAWELDIALGSVIENSFKGLSEGADPLREAMPASLCMRLGGYVGKFAEAANGGNREAAGLRLRPVLIFWTALCIRLVMDPEQIARDNLAKLARRQKEGALHGEGSDR